MTEKTGCEYREFCEVYSGKYKQSPMMTPEFRRTCDDTLKKDFVEGLCPIYDFHSGLFDLISNSLRETNQSLERTIKKLREK